MSRRAHWLQTTSGAVYPRDIVVFDTETREVRLSETLVEHKLVFGWAARIEWNNEASWSKPRWFRFTESIEFWRWLSDTTRSKRCTWAYCHNANFDWQVLSMPRLMPELGYSCETAMIEDPPNYFKWKRPDKSLKLLDSTNYWRVPLAKIGDRLGVKKLPFPENWDDPEVADAYCKRDCEILLLALQKWIEWLKDNRLGGLGITLAQQAWKSYTHRFLDEPIFIDDDIEAAEFARESYYGGRVECMTHGIAIRNPKCVDVNSMYPAVMASEEYPTRLHGMYKRVDLDELSKWLAKYAVTANVRVNTEYAVYPERSSDGLLFPIGEFDTYLSTPELQYGLEHGLITKCHAATIYDKANIFSSYVETMYELRRGFLDAGDEIAGWYTKIMQNSLYGKFGQRGIDEQIIGECDPSEMFTETELDLDTGIRYRNRHIGGVILSRTQGGESRFSFPAIAAHVTAYARMLLWKYMIAAGIENIYYMDTDSLHVNLQGYINLREHLSETELGKLKLEKSPEIAVYYGPKDYELDGVRVLKGVSARARQVSFGVFEQMQWASIKGSMVADHSGGPLVKRVVKRHAREYKKGSVTSGGLIRPFVRRLTRVKPRSY